MFRIAYILIENQHIATFIWKSDGRLSICISNLDYKSWF